MNRFVTSDQHFKHTNVLKLCNRDFKTIEEHDESLIKAWNEVVKKGDIVYHLGDLTLGNNARDLFSRLNGKIGVLNNYWHHDKRWIVDFLSELSATGDMVYLLHSICVLEKVVQVGEYKLPVILCHYPFETWDRKHYGSIHLHGHSHGTMRPMNNRYDVGVDVAFKKFGVYRPFYLEEAIELAKEI
jgi:calcineurin-like phosphoesterase family protein